MNTTEPKRGSSQFSSDTSNLLPHPAGLKAEWRFYPFKRYFTDWIHLNNDFLSMIKYKQHIYPSLKVSWTGDSFDFNRSINEVSRPTPLWCSKNQPGSSACPSTKARYKISSNTKGKKKIVRKKI